jgi:LysR family transcriptional regulator, repressor for citA
MDLKWLQTFTVAAKYENFRKTAEELFISQPSVTVHIKLMEEYIGSELFERIGRRVQLTAEGRRFLPYAKKLLAIHQEGIEDMEDFKQGRSRKLTLAISPLIASSIMPSILKKYMVLNPDISLEIQVMESKDIPAAVLEGQADCGLSRMLIVHTELTCSPLYADPVIMIAPHDGWYSESSPPVDMEELFRQHKILTHNHPEYWGDLLKQIKKKYSYVQTMVVTQIEVTKRFIEEGLGISFLPSSIVRRELLEGRFSEVLTEELSLPVARSYFIAKYQHEEGMRFRQFLSQFYYQ